MRTLIEAELQAARAALEAFLADETQLLAIQRAIEVLLACYKAGGKVVSCGNGGSLCDATHFAEELSGRFRANRPALPALALSDAAFLTCSANDFGYEQAFARGVEAFGKPGDVLLAISTSGNSPNILAAAKKAAELGMQVVALTGKGGGALAALANVEIRAPQSPWADRAQEIHIKVIHCLVAGVERGLGWA